MEQARKNALRNPWIQALPAALFWESCLRQFLCCLPNLLHPYFYMKKPLVRQTAHFLRLLCFHAPLPGIINMTTSYFQALGKAANSLTITVLRNVVLFIPGLILLNYLWQLNVVILTRLVIEVILTVICLIMYAVSSPERNYKEQII